MAKYLMAVDAGTGSAFDRVPILVDKMAQDIPDRSLEGQQQEIFMGEDAVFDDGGIIRHAADANYRHTGFPAHLLNPLYRNLFAQLLHHFRLAQRGYLEPFYRQGWEPDRKHAGQPAVEHPSGRLNQLLLCFIMYMM